ALFNFVWSLTGPGGTVVIDKPLYYAGDVINPDPTLNIASAFQSAQVYRVSRSAPVLPAGNYTLTLRAQDDAIGSYQFQLLNLASAPALTPGTPVSGTLTPAAASAAYSFSAAVGERFFFDLQSSSGGSATPLLLQLVDPAGNDLFGNPLLGTRQVAQGAP